MCCLLKIIVSVLSGSPTCEGSQVILLAYVCMMCISFSVDFDFDNMVISSAYCIN